MNRLIYVYRWLKNIFLLVKEVYSGKQVGKEWKITGLTKNSSKGQGHD